MYRRHMKTIGYLGKADRLFGGSADNPQLEYDHGDCRCAESRRGVTGGIRSRRTFEPLPAGLARQSAPGLDFCLDTSAGRRRYRNPRSG
jgi:hypothetical protein